MSFQVALILMYNGSKQRSYEGHCNALSFVVVLHICVATQRKGPYVGKIKIELCIACCRGYSADHFGTKIMHLAQFLTELLRILSFKTCNVIIKEAFKIIHKFCNVKN